MSKYRTCCKSNNTTTCEGPYGRRVAKGPEGVVALTRYRGLQFSSLYLGQGENLPHVIGEGKESDPEVLGPSRS